MPRPPPQNHDALQQQSSHHSAAGMQKSTHQPIKVIVFDKDKNLASFGFCKLKFDNEQGLHIQMLDTDLKETFTVAFEGLCMRKNRYLCFLSSENAIFLVFPDITKCEPIYNLFLAVRF
uniref:Uncharacterized protein n=1 Tax=Panagrolaimus davidi TaxID=227884 RepID=A0A914PBD6_9BILA